MRIKIAFEVAWVSALVSIGCGADGSKTSTIDQNKSHPTVSASQLVEKAAVPAVAQEGELNGDIFIVTKGGANIKLGLITVSAIPAAAIEDHVNKRKSEADAEIAKAAPSLALAREEVTRAHAEEKRITAIFMADQTAAKGTAYSEATFVTMRASDRLKTLSARVGRYNSGAFYLDALPPGIVTDKTDSDGKFTLRLPRTGKFAIAANASRATGGKTETYHWVVWTSLDGQASKRLMLSNDNMMGQGSPESALK